MMKEFVVIFHNMEEIGNGDEGKRNYAQVDP